jgi:hypothetical protein
MPHALPVSPQPARSTSRCRFRLPRRTHLSRPSQLLNSCSPPRANCAAAACSSCRLPRLTCRMLPSSASSPDCPSCSSTTAQLEFSLLSVSICDTGAQVCWGCKSFSFLASPPCLCMQQRRTLRSSNTGPLPSAQPRAQPTAQGAQPALHPKAPSWACWQGTTRLEEPVLPSSQRLQKVVQVGAAVAGQLLSRRRYRVAGQRHARRLEPHSGYGQEYEEHKACSRGKRNALRENNNSTRPAARKHRDHQGLKPGRVGKGRQVSRRVGAWEAEGVKPEQYDGVHSP